AAVSLLVPMLERLEPNPIVERHDDGVRDHRVVRLQVVGDLGDVREDLRPLVAQDVLAGIPADARDRGETRPLLAIDGEAIEPPLLTLPDLQGRNPHLRMILHGAGLTPVVVLDHPALPCRASSAWTRR